MGIWESALILLGIGLVSERFGAGVGLGQLGTGIQTLVAAPFMGTGTGLSSLAGGLRDIFETFGDFGRGLSALFAGIPAWALPGYVGPGGSGSGQLPQPGTGNGNGNGLTQVGGGDDTTNLPGGGGNVPNGRILTLGGTFPFTGTYAQAWTYFGGMGFTSGQLSAILNPHWGFSPDVGLDLAAGNLV